MKKIKVCHFTSVHKANDIRIFEKECTSLSEGGFEVFLVAVNTPEQTLNGVEIVNVPTTRNDRFTRMFFTTKRVYQTALSLNADIYHFHDPELLRFGLKLKKKGKIVVYDAHEDVPRQIMAKHWIPVFMRGLISSIVEKLENYYAKRLSFVVTSTPHIRKRFEKINQAMEICNYPLDKEIVQEFSWEDKKHQICYVGGLTKARGIGVLVDALNGTNDIKLNLAGTFGEGSEFENSVKSKHGWKKVNELGFLNREGIQEVYKNSKVGIVCLFPTPNHMESLPIKMFEYMGAGIPVIASNFPLWKEIVENSECGICVDPMNSDEIRDAILKIVNNPDIAKKMGENGKKIVREKYNWEIEKAKLIQIYNNLLSVELSKK